MEIYLEKTSLFVGGGVKRTVSLIGKKKQKKKKSN